MISNKILKKLIIKSKYNESLPKKKSTMKLKKNNVFEMRW